MRSLSTAFFLTTTFLASLPRQAGAQQITNGNFEDWHITPVFEDLDDWSTTNAQYPDSPPVIHVPGAGGVGNAVRLESHIYGSDSVFGYILAGEFVDDIPTEGVLFATGINTVKMDCRGEWTGGDSSLVFIGIWVGGALASVDAVTVGTSDTAWSQINFTVNGGVELLPDSVVFAVASSNPFSTYFTDGTWIEVDNIQLVGSDPNPDHLPNSNMELWHTVSTWDPEDWSTLNHYLIGLGDTAVTPDPLAYDGALSVRMETLLAFDDTIPGLLTNGTVSPQVGIAGGVPFTGTAISLDGWYRYEPVGADTARLFALWTASGVPVGVAEQVIVGGSSGWTAFSAPIFMPVAPDTLLITVTSGNNPGSVLQLDSLHFIGLSTGIAAMTATSWHLDSNPATDLVTIHTDDAIAPGTTYRVFDSMGRTVIAQAPAGSGPRFVIDVAALAPGRYWVELATGGQRHPLAFVKR